MGYARESQEPGNTGCSDRVMCLVGLKDCPRELEICSVRDGDRVNHKCTLELCFRVFCHSEYGKGLKRWGRL